MAKFVRLGHKRHHSVGKHQITLGFLHSAIIGVQTILVVYLGARTILDGNGFSVGMLFAFLAFRQTFTDRTQSFIAQGIQFKLLGVHLERLGDIVGTEPETRPGVSIPEIEPKGAMELRNISFRYGAGDPFVLTQVSLAIEAGEFIAITGASGGGKSTLFKLMLGLNAPTDGDILLDGQRATPEYWRSWRSHVGVVTQDDRLLSGTIADNIAFFDPDLSMEKVRAAADAAQVHEEIMKFPMQYLSLVGDMGSTLSGGQRQRILIARALYRQPRLLFLDEGTANLDLATEETIADLIETLPITRVIVAHRPALIRRATRALRVEGGALVPDTIPADGQPALRAITR